MKFLILSLALVLPFEGRSSVVLREKNIKYSCAALENFIEPGDIIFIQIDNFVYRKLVAEVTDSWASHVGIIFRNQHGEWFVSESTTFRAKETKLCDYIKRTKGVRYEVHRVKNFDDSQVQDLYNSTYKRLGTWYDTGFDFDEKGTSFCSKFVFDAFLEATGIQVGKIETLGEIRDKKLAKDPNYDYSFVKLWFVRLKIPWHRRTITPESQRTDSDLTLVVESY